MNRELHEDPIESAAAEEEERPYALASIEEEAATSVERTGAGAELAPLVQLLASGQYSPETIREMLDVQREYKADLAREAYAAALARFRAVAPTLAKDRLVDYPNKDRKGRTTYRHTSLGYAMAEVNPLLGEHGLNLSWHPTQGERGEISVETRLTHALGHSESVSLRAPPDDSGSKNRIQSIKSTITYLERTGAMALLGLASSDDDDGRGYGAPPEAYDGGERQIGEPAPAPPEILSDDQAIVLSDLLDEIERHSRGYRKRFVDHYVNAYGEAENALGLGIWSDKYAGARALLERTLEKARAEAFENTGGWQA